MDFTQIMQRYVRLREKFHRGELDAETYEEQVNSMVYKDDQGRYWQIGVESGKWYFYDGEKWVQDDLVEPDVNEPDESTIEEAEEGIPEFSVEHFFSDSESEEDPSGTTEEAFDVAFEQQLESQFAESSDSQQFDLFSDQDIFADILPREPEGDELSAPAIEVEGLAEHLLPTQPVSIESMLGEGEEISELSDDDIDFLFADDDETIVQEADPFDGEKLSDILFESSDDDLMDMLDADEDFYRSDQKVVTGELGIKAEPVSEESIKSLIHASYDDIETSGDELEVDNDFSEELEELSEEWFGPDLSKESFDELPWDQVDQSMAETQPVAADDDTDFDFVEFEEVSEELPDDLLEEPEADDLLEMNTVPDHDENPMLDTMQSSKVIPAAPKKKKKWLLPVGIALGLLVIVVAVLGGIYLAFQTGGKGDSPLAQVEENLQADDPTLILYDDFSNPENGWPIVEDYAHGVSNYTSGFYYVYAIDSETPTIVTTDSSYANVLMEIEMAQFKLSESTLTTYGVMCRVQPNGDGYAFRITSDGQYVIEEYRNGIFQPINGWKYSEAIKANRDVNQNKIKVYCNANQLSFEVNGQVLDIALSDTFTDGKVGLIVQTGGVESPAEVHYDNLYLRQP